MSHELIQVAKETKMTVAENLRAIMDEKGWTPERLVATSQDLGEPISVAAIKQWLDGKRIPSGQSAVALANALDCTTDEILRGTAAIKAAS